MWTKYYVKFLQSNLKKDKNIIIQTIPICGINIHLCMILDLFINFSSKLITECYKLNRTEFKLL